jgi:hypothetical protein
MSQLRLAHLPLIVAAVARGLLGTRTGRKVLAVGVGATALAVVVSGTYANTGGSDATTRREGMWVGLYNQYAPTKGELVLEGPAEASKCRLRGRAGSASGNGWVFHGSLSVAEVACEARIGKDGRVSAGLKFKEEWDGRVKGIGGDWEERYGSALCEGEVNGTVAAGGTWKGTCKTDEGRTYASSLTWTLNAKN